MRYQDINSRVISGWCRNGWEWGRPITHEVYEKALAGDWDVYLTPTRAVPHEWFGELAGRKLLGLASGGGQQLPIFTALGARCTLLDYSEEQCRSERMVAEREGYEVDIVCADMTRRLPFGDESFDIIFHPVSNCYVEKVEPIFAECTRVLRPGGILLGGFGLGLQYAFNEDTGRLEHPLPFDPLRDPELYERSLKNNDGIQFSHTVEEQLGGQLRAGFALTDLYEDTNGYGRLNEFNIPDYIATRAVKPMIGK